MARVGRLVGWLGLLATIYFSIFLPSTLFEFITIMGNSDSKEADNGAVSDAIGLERLI